MSTQPWIAHDHPERPLERGAWICGCGACTIALRATIAIDPRVRLVAKSETGRRVLHTASLRAEMNSAESDSRTKWLEVFVIS